MHWLVLATLAYFLIALEMVLDKFLLSSKKISHPAIYTFYSGVLSIFTLLFFFPFGWHPVDSAYLAGAISAGIIFTYGILSLFFSFQKSQVSRASVVAGAVIPIATYFLSLVVLKERLEMKEIFGAAALIAGGVLISLEFQNIRFKNFFAGFRSALLAGFLLALAFTLFKKIYQSDNFVNAFIWTRLGVSVGALSLLLFYQWRRLIFSSLKNFRNPRKENKKSGFLFVANKILGGSGSILLNYSISLGSVTIINALISIEYIFVFLMGIFLTFWFPDIFREDLDFGNIIQKTAAILIVAAGIALIFIK